MSEPFMGELRIMSFGFAPQGWAQCNGQLLPINQNQALFSLLGTTFGGNGQTTYALPDLRGRTPIHTGGGFTLGQAGGQTSHTVTVSELPAHVHLLNASSTAATTNVPANNSVLSASNPQNIFAQPTNVVAMAADAIGNTGGSQPHENMSPFLALTFAIALQGIFPSQN